MNPDPLAKPCGGPRAALLFLSLLTALIFNSTVGVAEEADLPGTIRMATFRASAFTYQVSGSLLWLEGADDLVRLEILRSDNRRQSASPLQTMLNRQGEGWTAILGGSGHGTLNAWGREWRRPPQGLAEAVHLVSAALLAGPTVAGSVGPWRARGFSGHLVTHRIASLDPVGERPEPRRRFRDNLAARGWGRGGNDDMLELAWLPRDTGGQALLRVRASRRPGQIDLMLQEHRNVIYASPETFVPLWPMAQLVTVLP